MDPAGVGALGGMGIILCVGFTMLLNDYGIFNKCKRRYTEYRQTRQPLLPVTTTNPLLVRSQSKQWKIKELVERK